MHLLIAAPRSFFADFHHELTQVVMRDITRPRLQQPRVHDVGQQAVQTRHGNAISSCLLPEREMAR
ncbi:hypothetical protein ACGFIE_01210 [Micromonospora sp. NPDC049275]|uniref:hypothetical protein n=1 Tax=Micromonospora sp. NPDC049275 TaxID=3364268 RepID=UPI0037162764